jgi:hypothetical protein
MYLRVFDRGQRQVCLMCFPRVDTATKRLASLTHRYLVVKWRFRRPRRPELSRDALGALPAS